MDAWDKRIGRAEALARVDPVSGEMLAFYARLLRTQQRIAQQLAENTLAGDIERDVAMLRPLFPLLLDTVSAHGPEPLADAARELAEAADEARGELIVEQWRAPEEATFFAKAMLQPYAGLLRERALAPRDRDIGPDNRCPFCGGMPQLSVLSDPAKLATVTAIGSGAAARAADDGGRSLLCATCLHTWPFPRILCPNCGEEDESRLGYYQASPAFDHVRVDACETCLYYLKSIDLTRLGYAVPIVDEMASASLDIWAQERGYRKIELNLVGL